MTHVGAWVYQLQSGADDHFACIDRLWLSERLPIFGYMRQLDLRVAMILKDSIWPMSALQLLYSSCSYDSQISDQIGRVDDFTQLWEVTMPCCRLCRRYGGARSVGIEGHLEACACWHTDCTDPGLYIACKLTLGRRRLGLSLCLPILPTEHQKLPRLQSTSRSTTGTISLFM